MSSPETPIDMKYVIDQKFPLRKLWYTYHFKTLYASMRHISSTIPNNMLLC